MLPPDWIRSFGQKPAGWFLHTGLLLDQIHLAQTWPGHPDQAQASFAQYDPCFLWKNGTESDIVIGKSDSAHMNYDLARFWLHAGRNGHNQNASELDPACLQGVPNNT